MLGAEMEDSEDGVDIDPKVRLMYSTNEGDIEGIKEILECGTDVNFRDIDKRTTLHVAAFYDSSDVVQLLLDNGAEVDQKIGGEARPLSKKTVVLLIWPCQGSCQAVLWDEKPSALNVIHYKNHAVIKLLEKHGAKPPVSKMKKEMEKVMKTFEY
ncbi:hypothetical protein T459_25453 [Capsicum annuum]|uniref:Uncharacterized protein n=1 Tax=Capsicum annuum TaxID=4072 RepID=A0A2G2YKU8_CAPAN|nr:hypothetical protein T459_25453 [Capsicum annuum]